VGCYELGGSNSGGGGGSSSSERRTRKGGCFDKGKVGSQWEMMINRSKGIPGEIEEGREDYKGDEREGCFV